MLLSPADLYNSGLLRVLVADDFPLVLEAHVAALERRPGVEVVGTASDGVEALELARELRPDVMVLDLRMPGMSGMVVLRKLSEELPDVRVLLVSATEEADPVVDAVSAGAAGFLTKRVTGDEMAEAVVAIGRGESIISPALTAHLVSGLRRGEDGRAKAGSASGLTPSELNVLRLVAAGRTDKQISEALYISPRTVQSHLTAIRAKIGLRRRVELTRWAAEHLVT